MKATDPSQRGAALLTVLLLVAVMATASALTLERLTRAARLSGSAAAMEQARFHQLSAEAFALQRIGAVASGQNAALANRWQGQDMTTPLPNGSATIRITDGGNCFNVNSLVAANSGGAPAARPLAMEQLRALLAVLGVDTQAATRIAAAAADRIDADMVPLPSGDEAGGPNAPLTDSAQLTQVPGMTPQIWSRLSPWVCALPSDELSPININTLMPEQAPLLQMLVGPDLTAAAARAQLAVRPADGFASVTSFWQSGSLRDLRVPEDAAQQVRTSTRWFRLNTNIRVDDVVLAGSSLIDATAQPFARVVGRRWEEAQ